MLNPIGNLDSRIQQRWETFFSLSDARIHHSERWALFRHRELQKAFRETRCRVRASNETSQRVHLVLSNLATDILEIDETMVLLGAEAISYRQSSADGPCGRAPQVIPRASALDSDTLIASSL